MINTTAQEIIKLIKNSSYVFESHELTIFEALETVVSSGADLESNDALQLENIFEKIKRGGFLNL